MYTSSIQTVVQLVKITCVVAAYFKVCSSLSDVMIIPRGEAIDIKSRL